MMVKHLDSIRLTAEEMPVTARLSSGRPIFSPTSPSKPECIAGCCDRWWLENKPGKNVAIRYWIFESPEDAETSATNGRKFLSARMIYIGGQWESIYREVTANENYGDKTWRADNNILFVKNNVVVQVSEPARQVDLEIIQSIARRIETKIANIL